MTWSPSVPGSNGWCLSSPHQLVVRPDPADVARLAVRVTASHIFSVIVIDRCGLPGASVLTTRTRWNIAVRRLALAASESDTTIILLSTRAQARQERLPTAMRIELTRPSTERVKMHITKDRQGRQMSPVAIPVADLLSDSLTDLLSA